ncbi:hypothetical protein HDZ31DRAFT_63209 [Schizophyllum fasciatum]
MSPTRKHSITVPEAALKPAQPDPALHHTCPKAEARDSSTKGHGDTQLDLLVRSFHAPTSPEEVKALCDRLSKVHASLRDCTLEIDRLESTLFSLRRHTAALREDEKNIKALLAPVRVLPPEIVAEIAAYTLPDNWFEDVIGVHIWSFSQVCHTWREIAISMRWPWTRLCLPCRTSMAEYTWQPTFLWILSLYLSRSGDYPLSVRTIWNQGAYGGYWTTSEQPMWKRIWSHADRLHGLEVFCSEFDNFPFPSTLPALAKLTINNHLTGILRVDAPQLRVLELVETNAMFVDVTWANLRALKIRCEMFGDDFRRIGQCQRLEVLSLTQDVEDLPIELESSPISLPSLHTLEICRAAISICPYIVAPSLRHFILDNVRYRSHWENEISPQDIHALFSLLRPITSITLRNSAHYDTDLVIAVMSIPERLRKLVLVEDTEPKSLAPRTIPRELALKLISMDGDALAFPHLAELHVINGTKGISWAGYDVALVHNLLHARVAFVDDHCVPLTRLKVHTPFAIFPISKECVQAGLRDGRQTLDIDNCATSIPIDKTEPACFYETFADTAYESER